MAQISLDKYKLFCELEGQHELLFERWVSKKNRNKISNEEFGTISKLISNLKMIKSGLYSEHRIEKFKLENEQMRELFLPEVYAKIVEHDWNSNDPWD
ncbi:hypothetical protein [Winogradskyella sp.]|uniref:hypothetical protein n=1 Tax=Winogradskyella sp. TaxID=1883156 RepID=UPI002623D3D4|nr:hypothetical protein [Winogradskyella sp.]